MSKNCEGLLLGLSKLKKGALSMFFLEVFSLAGLLLVLLWMTPYYYTMYTHEEIERDIVVRWYLSSQLSLYVMLVSGIIGLIILYRYWYKATVHLEECDWNRFEIGKVGMLLTLIGGITLVAIVTGATYIVSTSSPMDYLHYHGPTSPNDIISLYMMVSWILTIPCFIGIILGVVGMIMFSIMLIRLSRENGVSPNFHTAGIILLMAVILSVPSILNILGWVLMIVANIIIYVGAKESIEKLRHASK